MSADCETEDSNSSSKSSPSICPHRDVRGKESKGDSPVRTVGDASSWSHATRSAVPGMVPLPGKPSRYLNHTVTAGENTHAPHTTMRLSCQLIFFSTRWKLSGYSKTWGLACAKAAMRGGAGCGVGTIIRRFGAYPFQRKILSARYGTVRAVDRCVSSGWPDGGAEPLWEAVEHSTTELLTHPVLLKS